MTDDAPKAFARLWTRRSRKNSFQTLGFGGGGSWQEIRLAVMRYPLQICSGLRGRRKNRFNSAEPRFL